MSCLETYMPQGMIPVDIYSIQLQLVKTNTMNEKHCYSLQMTWEDWLEAG